MNDHAELIDKFIASFEVVAENLDVLETIEPIAAQLAVGPTNEYGAKALAADQSANRIDST
jgi:hypothetical protein